MNMFANGHSTHTNQQCGKSQHKTMYNKNFGKKLLRITSDLPDSPVSFHVVDARRLRIQLY